MNYRHLKAGAAIIRTGDVSFESGQLCPIVGARIGHTVYNNFTFRPLSVKWRHPSEKPLPHEIDDNGDVLQMLRDGSVGLWPATSLGPDDPSDEDRKALGWLPFYNLPRASEIDGPAEFPSLEDWAARLVPPDGLSTAALGLWWVKRGNEYEKLKKEHYAQST